MSKQVVKIRNRRNAKRVRGPRATRVIRVRPAIRRRARRPQAGFLDKLGTFAMKGIPALIKAITGFGDYRIQSNSLITGGLDPPAVVNSINNGGFIVRHREYLQDIPATVDFSLNMFPINVGIAATFPWLSSMAQSFEQYRVRGMVFEFKSLAFDAVLSTATSSALGSVIMATQYNVLDLPFNNKFEMENYVFANSSKPSMNFYHPIECAKVQTTVTELYVRNETVPVGADPRLYDMGRFNIGTVGMQAASGVVGELWVTYEVELFKPKIPAQVDPGMAYDFWQFIAPSNSFPFNSSVHVSGNLGSSFPSTTILSLPAISAGAYWIQLNYYTVSAGTTPTFTPTYFNCTALNLFDNYTAPYVQNNPGGIGNGMLSIAVQNATSGASLLLNFGTANYLRADMLIVYIPDYPTIAKLMALQSSEWPTSEEMDKVHNYFSKMQIGK